ncbi:protein RarD [Actinocatenispora comari]|uniref:Protein RarD n=1 Tax=Actinocatenispora comari TaxID=2807577 RepID=A0A8J4A9K2_9ACTN|nr:protein RarD [Actinocatenispora comari]
MRVDETRRGYLYGLVAYGLWGLFPIYWKLLRPAGAVEILANRILWSAVCCALLLVILRQWRWIAGVLRRPRTVAKLVAAAGLIAVNWGTYIYGVNSGHVVETALGYFINPLVSILLGVAILRERLRRLQWVAIVFGLAAVVVITVDYGRPPWIALTLAASFGLYGLTKKTLRLPAARGLFAESALLALPAAGYLVYLSATGTGTFGTISVGHTLLLVGGGLVTMVPLLSFASAANRLPLTAIGVLQYLTPTMQLCCGLILYGEPMPAPELIGFVLVWIALAVFTADLVHQARRSRLTPVTVQAAETAEL